MLNKPIWRGLRFWIVVSFLTLAIAPLSVGQNPPENALTVDELLLDLDSLPFLPLNDSKSKAWKAEMNMWLKTLSNGSNTSTGNIAALKFDSLGTHVLKQSFQMDMLKNVFLTEDPRIIPDVKGFWLIGEEQTWFFTDLNSSVSMHGESVLSLRSLSLDYEYLGQGKCRITNNSTSILEDCLFYLGGSVKKRRNRLEIGAVWEIEIPISGVWEKEEFIIFSGRRAEEFYPQAQRWRVRNGIPQ